MDRFGGSTLVVTVATALVIGVFGAYWFSTGARADRVHDRAVERWEGREPSAYSFDFSYCSGMCADCPVRVNVTEGEVVQVLSLGEANCSAPSREGAPTIEDVFALEEGARSTPSIESFEISYDPNRGFPTSGSYLCADGSSDCGTYFRVSNFRVVVSTTPST